MGKKVCLDTGKITQYFVRYVPPSIDTLMKKVQARTEEALCLTSMLVEAFYHMCRVKGKDAAQANLAHFLKIFPITFIYRKW